MGIADFLQPFASSLTYICVLVLATFAITLIYKTSATTNFAQGSIAVFGSYFGTSFFLVFSHLKRVVVGADPYRVCANRPVYA